ncbi:hypothetical protein ACN27F_19775 [Solwaraspora sp. WMMB335]|uniref:hypothetical protein n=1 Tax=Solwaraspora sp. WMMB335 TaxID=3404118 RepID=UPI003B936F72
MILLSLRDAVVVRFLVELTSDEQVELRALINSAEVSAVVGTRARIVLWHAESRLKKDIAALAKVSRPTVDLSGSSATVTPHQRGTPRSHPSDETDPIPHQCRI